MNPGDIRQDTAKLARVEDWVASYLGNGIIGGCFDYAGLQFQDGTPGRPDIIGDTYFVSQYHYVHGKFGMDYALPIGRLQARILVDGREIEPSDPSGFAELDQVLDIREGVLRTEYALAQGACVRQQQFASQTRKNLFVLRTECDHPIQFEFRPIEETGYHYAGHFRTDILESAIDGLRVWQIPTNLQTTAVGTRQVGCDLFISIFSSIECPDPAVRCVAEIDTAARIGFDGLLEEQRSWWRRYYESDLDVAHPLGDIWRRANYYIGCSFADQRTHPPLVFGLARVQWPAYFPQDYFYAYENTLAANHLAQAAGTSEFWHEILPHARGYARRLFGLEGSVYPWTPPVFDWSNYHHDGEVPNKCYYEMHNSAYVAKMCWDYHRYTLDEDYLRDRAWPVIREIAQMYASMTSIVDGRARIDFTPNMSQDEYSPQDMPNYFDTLVSAEYALTLARGLAQRFGDAETGQLCSTILDAGYVYEHLHVGDTYAVYEGDTRTSDFQKHPVQLHPITWLPIERFFVDPRIANYHSRRYDICQGYKDASSTAWTLGQFMIASCRLRKPDELARDIANIARCRIMDPDYIQTFESSRRSSHFLTTIGLFMQAITETLVQSHGRAVDFFPCLLPEWRGQRVEFRSIRLPGRFTASGVWDAGCASIEVRSERGGAFAYTIDNGSSRELKTEPGEVYTIHNDNAA